MIFHNVLNFLALTTHAIINFLHNYVSCLSSPENRLALQRQVPCLPHSLQYPSCLSSPGMGDTLSICWINKLILMKTHTHMWWGRRSPSGMTGGWWTTSCGCLLSQVSWFLPLYWPTKPLLLSRTEISLAQPWPVFRHLKESQVGWEGTARVKSEKSI